MDEKLLQGSAKKIIALVECANTIERLSQTKEINGPEELRNDHNTYLALSKLAHKAYETGSKCKVFVHTFRGELRTRRNQFSHLEEDLTKPAVLGRPGIDTITEEEFWASDLSPQGYLQKILHAIYNALKNPAIATEVDRQRKENELRP
jgi:hypothetical protein